MKSEKDQKAVAMVRVSTEGQDVGAAAQERTIRTWAEQLNIEIVSVYEDRVSGIADISKRSISAAVRKCSSSGARFLVATDWDRFSRDKHMFTDIERACERAGIVPATVEGGLNEAPILRDIKQALAAQERRQISVRNIRRVTECNSRGQLHGGKPRFGFRRKAGGRHGTRNTVVELEADPREQAVIRKIHKLKQSGMSIRKIVDALNGKLKLKARTGQWTPTKIQRIIGAQRR